MCDHLKKVFNNEQKRQETIDASRTRWSVAAAPNVKVTMSMLRSPCGLEGYKAPQHWTVEQWSCIFWSDGASELIIQHQHLTSLVLLWLNAIKSSQQKPP